MTLETALEILWPEEGGYVDNPNDKGGPTCYGVTQPTLDKWNDAHGIERHPVMLMSMDTASAIYLDYYWIPSGCQHLQENLGVMQFDTCVNEGQSRAIKYMQQTLGVAPEDGLLGPVTTLAFANAVDSTELITLYAQQRRVGYFAICDANHSQGVFLKGWLNRVDALRDKLLVNVLRAA